MVERFSKLRVWWNPQLGSSHTFYIPVSTPEEGYKIMNTLAYYDCFLENNNVRGDYANAGGLQYFDFEEDDWLDWYYDFDDKYYNSIDEYVEEERPDLLMFSKNLAGQVSFDHTYTYENKE